MNMNTVLRVYQTPPHRWRFPILSLTILLALLAAVVLISSLGQTARVAAQPLTVFVVTNLNDNGPGSLRQAILDANANPGMDQIIFDLPDCIPASPCVITPLTLLPVISDPAIISGPGMSSLAVDANHSFRAFTVAPVPVIITDLTIQNGATTGRGAGIRAFGPLTLVGVQLLGNQAEDDGGGVFAAGPLTVNESYFAQNAAYNGGGLYGESNLTLTNSHFISNTAVHDGGGAYGNEAVSVVGACFEENQVEFRGGGLYAGGELIAEETIFVGNMTSYGFGGGAFAYEAVWINGGSFENNFSDEGGGLWTWSSAVITETLFISNTAYSYGGGLSASVVQITQGRFENNYSGYEGGALAAWSNLVLEDTMFLSNIAVAGSGGGASSWGNMSVSGGSFVNNSALHGGGLYASDDLTIEGTVFLNNTAEQNGGGAYGYANVSISGGLFQNNSAGQGGGLYTWGDVIEVVDTSFIGNRALDGRGGGIAMPGLFLLSGPTGDARTLSLAHTHFISNTASYAGGGVSAYTTLLIDSSMFNGNDAPFGGGVYHGAGDGQVVNSLFARNTADNTGSALALDSDSAVEIVHATIVGDTGQNVPGIALNTGGLLLQNSIVTRHVTGVRNVSGVLQQDYNLFYQNGANINGSFSGGGNNVSGDPKFVAPESGDFHIGAGSAALDAGVNVGVTVDFEGDNRPFGDGFDIGFDEADLSTPLQHKLHLPVILK